MKKHLQAISIFLATYTTGKTSNNGYDHGVKIRGAIITDIVFLVLKLQSKLSGEVIDNSDIIYPPIYGCQDKTNEDVIENDRPDGCTGSEGVRQYN